MIESFLSKGLAEIFGTGATRRINPQFHARIRVRLTALDNASKPEDMNISGYDFHALKGFVPTRYTIHVNGPWCITFEFHDGGANRVDFESYH